jgi:hypothetical protein
MDWLTTDVRTPPLPHTHTYAHTHTHRDAAVVTFTAGAILNALFGKVLKRIIKEVRRQRATM